MKKQNLILTILLLFIMILVGTVTVKASADAFHNFTGLYVVTTEAKKGEKVYVEFYGMDDATEVKLYLMGKNGDYLSANVVDYKTKNPYFIMPDIAKEGENYTITLIEITCEHGTIQYATSEGGAEYVTNCFERKYVKVIESKEKIELTNLALANPNNIIKKGENERLYLNVELKGADDVDLITMSVKGKDPKNTGILVSLDNDDGVQYIDLIDIGTQYPLANGDYYISDLFINPFNVDYIRYSTDKNATNAIPLEYNIEFTVANVEEEKVDNTTLNDLNGNENHYREDEIISNDEHLDSYSQLTVEDSDDDNIDIFSLNNDKITMDIIQKISQLDSNNIIKIDASSNPIVIKSLFEAIKGQDKILIIKYNDIQWIFNGKDIENSKTIDVSVQLTNNIVDLNGKVKEGVKIDFAESGELPGKCLIRVYNSNLLNEKFNRDELNIYFYDENKELFDKIALNLNMTEDGYYEFYIKHNSSYIMTKEEISEEFIIKENEETEQIKDLEKVDANEEIDSIETIGEYRVEDNKLKVFLSYNVFIILVILVVLIIILVIVIIVLTRRVKKV